MADDLAAWLRAWRDRMDPACAGVSDDGPRRAPGLRRQEVAERAGISTDYLMRLEQGRATAPSVSVIGALVRALALDDAEAALLHRLAGHADTTRRVAARTVTPSARRILDRFDDAAVLVVDPAWTVVAANDLARGLLDVDVVGQNVAVREFAGPRWVRRDPDEERRFERELVSDLHIGLARHPDDEAIRATVAQLRDASRRFAALWDDPPAETHGTSRKTFLHPAGVITVDCDTFALAGSDLRIVLWTPRPGSPDAEALERLRAGDAGPLAAQSR
jgi:transcriptional regulator with XRE-family HTH domain